MTMSIICTSKKKNVDLSLAGTEFPDCDPFDFQAEPCDLTFGDIKDFEDDDDPDRLDLECGWGVRLSEFQHDDFWTYFDRFVRYWPRKTFHVKYAYPSGFLEKKKRQTGTSQPLFEELAVEFTERHLDSDSWAMWKNRQLTIPNASPTPIWLGLHLPKLTTVDLIDIDAKKYLLGYYRIGWSDNSPLMPVVHLPLEHFKLLKRVYDQFPGRIWCISSETLGVHAWRKHKYPQPSLKLHEENKQLLAEIGQGDVEAHPMPRRCLRRPFGADYRTITPDGLLTDWIEQLRYFENDGRTPAFQVICRQLVTAMYQQWRSWERASAVFRPNMDKVPCRRDVLEPYLHELQEVADWLNAGCPLEPIAVAKPVVDNTTSLCREVLADTLNDNSETDADPILLLCREIFLELIGERPPGSSDLMAPEIDELLKGRQAGSSTKIAPRPRSRSRRQDLAALRNGNWPKELLRLARVGLEQENSVGLVVHEMAKWLWWIELFSLPESNRKMEITELLTAFVLKRHNGCVTRLSTGNEEDVISQISRCVDQAAAITDPSSLKGFADTRAKWLNGGYKTPIRIVPALTGKEELSSSSPCQFTVMCINFDDPLPDCLQARIRSAAGRNRVLSFATLLINRLYNKNGQSYLGRPALMKLLGYTNPNQVAKYLDILERAGVIRRGGSYRPGRNGKLFKLGDGVMEELNAARSVS